MGVGDDAQGIGEECNVPEWPFHPKYEFPQLLKTEAGLLHSS